MTMKIEFTFVFRRLALVFTAVLAFAANAEAGSTWYAYYTRLAAYPTGQGTVYASKNYNDVNASDLANYSAEQDLKFTATTGMFYGFAQPAAGYKLAGFSQATADENGEFVFSDSIISTSLPATLTASSSYTDNPTGDQSVTSDSATVSTLMPLDPETQFYALFTKVTVEYAAGQSSLGKLSISKVCNDTGDEITVKATPANDQCKFDRWTIDGKTVSTDASYSMTVQDTATIVAHFTSEYAKTYDLGTGKWFFVHSDSMDYSIPDNVSSYTFNANRTHISAKGSYSTPFRAGYNLPASQAHICYGAGEVTLVASKADYVYPDENSLNRWSGDNGVMVDTLDVQHHYYMFDGPAKKLDLVDAGSVIPAQQVFVGIPDSLFTNAGLSAPQTIYTDSASAANAATGISSVKKAVLPGLGQIYTLDGRRVNAMRHDGVYVVDGRKVIYRKK